MQIDDGENRFAVLKIPVLQKDIPDIIAKCEVEVPAFIDYLLHRELHYQTGQSRFSFDTKIYETEFLKTVQSRTTRRLVREIDDFIKNYFIQHNLKIVYLTPTDIAEYYNAQSGKFKIEKSEISDYLKYDLKRYPEPKQRYNLYHTVTEMPFGSDELREVSQIKINKAGTPYKFCIEDYFTEDEIKLM
jgi:hypothetical protein